MSARAWSGPGPGWTARSAEYGDGRDDLARGETSRLSAYLRFGCVSPVELARAALPRPGGEDFCRQLAWRDFFHQVTAALPGHRHGGLPARPPGGRGTGRGTRTRLTPGGQGAPASRSSTPGMRQLAAEGFMHNRARMITASFLTRTLGIDWRTGTGTSASCWPTATWPATRATGSGSPGTGNNPRPGRVLNPLRQAARFDHDGEYVRRYVPELAGLAAPQVHAPWKLPGARRGQLRYPDPLIDFRPDGAVRPAPGGPGSLQ